MIKNTVIASALLMAMGVAVAGPYALDSSKDPVMTQFGECVRTSEWTVAKARADKHYVKCERPTKVTVNQKAEVFFEVSKSELIFSEKQKLDKVVLDTTPLHDRVVVVTGHTDETGPADFNMKLAQERADEVAKYITYYNVKTEVRPSSILKCEDKNPECLVRNRKADVEATGWKYVDRYH